MVGVTLINAGLVQEILPTPVVVNEILVFVHVRIVDIGAEMLTEGAVLFCVII
jgi:hypothetical protein